jgi:hypothetical protein
LTLTPSAPWPTKSPAAADRYAVKFGRRPNLCYVNDAQLNGDRRECGTEIGGVQLVGAPNVLRHHFWIGED